MAGSRHKDAFTGAHPENIRRRKIITVISLILILILFSMIAYFVGRPLMKQLRDSPETFRDYVYSHRLLGPFLMVGIMMLQVIIAIIPGGPCELAAGFVFGWLEGAVLCMIGSILASSLVGSAIFIAVYGLHALSCLGRMNWMSPQAFVASLKPFSIALN